jgi:hypothetical protein
MKRLLLAAVAVLALVAPASARDPAFVWPKNSQFSCTGVLVKDEHAYQLRPDEGMLTWCDADLWEGKELRALKTCSLGNRCEIKGVIQGHGAFAWTKINSVRRTAAAASHDADAAETYTCRGLLTVNWTEGVAVRGRDDGTRLIRADDINESCLFEKNSAAGKKILAVCRMGFPCNVKARVDDDASDVYVIQRVYSVTRD